MSKSPDPESLADLALRSETEHDTSRTRKEPSWSRPKITDQWPCRTCGEPVDVTAEAHDALNVFDRILAERGEQSLDTNAIMFCNACRDKHRASAADRRSRENAALKALIVKLKASRQPEQEHELIAQIRNWGHPDVEGLVQAIRDRLASKGPTKAKAGA